MTALTVLREQVIAPIIAGCRVPGAEAGPFPDYLDTRGPPLRIHATGNGRPLRRGPHRFMESGC